MSCGQFATESTGFFPRAITCVLFGSCLVCHHSVANTGLVLKARTNTAENFIWASQFLNTTFQEFDSIYVVTSAFHHERASVMFKLIDPSRNYNWILGNVEEKDSRYWETKHIVNALSDVEKAKAKLNLL